MEYFDEKILEAKRELERQKHTTLKTGIYAGEELITFTQRSLPGSKIHLFLPDQFVEMPDVVKNIKYPSRDAASFILTSLDSTVNIGFNHLPRSLQEGEVELMSSQFQNALHNMNPAIKISNQLSTKTGKGNELSRYEYKGYHLDGQSYNRIYLIRMRKTVLHVFFNCQLKDMNNWMDIMDKIIFALEEDT